MKKLIYGLCLIALTQQLVAQEKENKAIASPFGLSIYVGPSFGGLSKTELTHLMQAAGLGGTEYGNNGFVGTTINYPVVIKGGNIQLGFMYQFKKNWAMRGIISKWGDHAEGYAEVQRKRVDFSYKGFSASLLCSRVSASNVFRMGVGPFLSAVSGKLSGSPTKRVLRAGYMLDAGVRFPAFSPLFIDIALQYQHAGVVTYGPYRLGISGPKSAYIFPKVDLPLNYLHLAFGVGIRL